MIEIEYNHRIKQTSIVVAVPNSVARKMIGSKKYKRRKNN